jgi:hypothetical protein
MHSSLIGKIEKARRYAQEPERIRIRRMALTFQGDHDAYHLTLADDAWTCSCTSFALYGTCAHVMAVQRICELMLTPEARTATSLHGSMPSSLIGKIEKARRYAQQPERIRLEALALDFQGGHDLYHIALQDEVWTCSCEFFRHYGTCAHVMAVQRIHEPMLSATARTASGLVAAL